MDFTALRSTVRGHTHARRGVACEDFSRTASSGEPSWRVVVVGDGHGDPTCVRSARGSRAVCDVAVRCMGEFANNALAEAERRGTATADLLRTSEGELALNRLTDAIVYEWSAQVVADLAENPLTEDELAQIGGPRSPWVNRAEHLYGTTLVAGLLLSDALVLAQLGDGCCAVVFADGEIVDPVPPDELCVGNVTTSLSDNDAAEEVRRVVLDLRERPIVACYVATDGVEKSLSVDGGVADFFGMLTTELPEHVAAGDVQGFLDATLDQLNRLGSGDDSSVALVCNLTGVARIAGMLSRRHELYTLQAHIRWAQGKQVSMQRKRDYLLELPPTEGGAGERERYLAEYDELTGYIQDLEARMASLLEEEGTPATDAEHAHDADEAGVGEGGGLGATTNLFRALEEGAGEAQAALDSPQPTTKPRRYGRGAGRSPILTIVIMAALGFAVLGGGLVLRNCRGGGQSQAEQGKAEVKDEPGAEVKEDVSSQGDATAKGDAVAKGDDALNNTSSVGVQTLGSGMTERSRAKMAVLKKKGKEKVLSSEEMDALRTVEDETLSKDIEGSSQDDRTIPTYTDDDEGYEMGDDVEDDALDPYLDDTAID